MALLPVLIDPTGEGTGTELDINDGAPGRSGYVIEAPVDMPPPAVKSIYADSASTEGSIPVEDEPKYENRPIGLKVHVYGTTAADLQNNLAALYGKIGKLNREGGTLSVTTAAEIECIFDLLPESNGPATFDERYLSRNHTLVELTLTARPFWRGTEIDLGTFPETTLPALVFEVSDVPGDVPALGRLVVTDLSGNDQWQVDVGVQSRYYDSAATAALFYQAEDLTPLGISTDTAGAAGASGTNVIRNTNLVPAYQAILKSEIDSSNAALTHKGSFRAKARLYRPTSNTGEVSAQLEYALGDYRNPDRSNLAVVYPADDQEGVFTWADLGVVHIAPDSERWEFRILAKSTVVGDEIDVDCICLFPTTEGYIELSGAQAFENSTAFVARDEFEQSAGAAAGKTLPIGGTWSGAGDPTDFVMTGAPERVMERAELNDSGVFGGIGTGRWERAGTSTATDIAVQVDAYRDASTQPEGGGTLQGVFARYADTNNFLAAVFESRSDLPTRGQTRLVKRVAGTNTVLAAVGGSASTSLPPAAEVPPFVLTHSTWYTIRLVVDAMGRVVVWMWPRDLGLPAAPVLTAQDSVLATGGTLATGGYGVYDENNNSLVAWERKYDNFSVFVPGRDAAIYASRSLELRHDNAQRYDSSGSFPSRVSRRRGRFLRISPSTHEGRSTRLLVKGHRNDPVAMADPGIDDIQAQLFATPRGLVVPDA